MTRAASLICLRPSLEGRRHPRVDASACALTRSAGVSVSGFGLQACVTLPSSCGDWRSTAEGLTGEMPGRPGFPLVPSTRDGAPLERRAFAATAALAQRVRCGSST